MKESIYTIPLSEAFEARTGCPLCSLRASLEQNWVQYITGAAMMEPDVRQKTNEEGFCARHYEKMLGQRNRLSVALMLQSHLECLEEALAATAAGRYEKKSGSNESSCFVCGMMDREFERILENLVTVWARDTDFQKMYIQQRYVCIYDYKRLVSTARHKLRGKPLVQFLSETAELARRRITTVKSDIDAFCALYDYRSAGQPQPSEDISLAIERAVSFLTGEVK